MTKNRPLGKNLKKEVKMSNTDLNISLLPYLLEMSWTENTSSDSGWSEYNPALGQCAVTALIIQDYFGGDILRCMVDKVSHYYNRLPDGTFLDETASQFNDDEIAPIEFRNPTTDKGRDYLLSSESTSIRYEMLKKAFDYNRLGIDNPNSIALMNLIKLNEDKLRNLKLGNYHSETWVDDADIASEVNRLTDEINSLKMRWQETVLSHARLANTYSLMAKLNPQVRTTEEY